MPKLIVCQAASARWHQNDKQKCTTTTRLIDNMALCLIFTSPSLQSQPGKYNQFFEVGVRMKECMIT